MARRYGTLADALDDLSLHFRAEDRGRLARDCQKAASALREAEHMPPDPSEIYGIDVSVRDYIAEWRAFGEIERLDQLNAKRPYLTNLATIAKVGPTTAERLYEEAGLETVEDVKAYDSERDLENISGIGPKTATTIRRSIAQINT